MGPVTAFLECPAGRAFFGRDITPIRWGTSDAERWLAEGWEICQSLIRDLWIPGALQREIYPARGSIGWTDLSSITRGNNMKESNTNLKLRTTFEDVMPLNQPVPSGEADVISASIPVEEVVELVTETNRFRVGNKKVRLSGAGLKR